MILRDHYYVCNFSKDYIFCYIHIIKNIIKTISSSSGDAHEKCKSKAYLDRPDGFPMVGALIYVMHTKQNPQLVMT